MNSAGTIGGDDFLFVPTLVGLMRNRRLKEPARKVLVGYGEAVVPTLAYFLGDNEEDIWVRRHVPATLAAFRATPRSRRSCPRSTPLTDSCASRP